MRWLAALLLAGVLAPAAAAAPATTTTHEDVDMTIVIPAGARCAFAVVAHAEGIFTVKAYTDASGAVVREIASVQQSYTITYTNPLSGRSISTVLGGPARFSYGADGSTTVAIAGRERLFVAPGEGPVAMQVGRIVYRVAADGSVTTLFEAGRWDDSVWPGVCAYLA